jgi:hypothetical protein
MVEQQTFDMKKYQEEKDELEREAMLRDPAKAFLVSDEEFDKKIDELGWSLGDMDTMINMYGRKRVYDMGESAAMVPGTAGTVLPGGLAADRHAENFLLIVLSLLGRFPLRWPSMTDSKVRSPHGCHAISAFTMATVGDMFGAILSRIQILCCSRHQADAGPTFNRRIEQCYIAYS